jgi:hypothetical protein
LESNDGGDSHSKKFFCDDRRKNAACYSGTDHAVPFRYGPKAPRLSAAFVAQLLGQMMPDLERDNSGALAVYRKAPAPALLCDQRL